MQSDNLCLFRSDPNTKQILESMRSGAINIKQAAEALGMEPAMLAYQLAGRVRLIAQLYKKKLQYFYDRLRGTNLTVTMTLLRMRMSMRRI